MTKLSDFNSIRTVTKVTDPEILNSREARSLKETCQQFESILVAEIWKKMSSLSRKMGKDDEESSSSSSSESSLLGDRPYGQMEEVAIEMSAEEISKSGGVGLWKVLYDQMLPQIANELKTKK